MNSPVKKRALVIFRRDLRVEDNTALNAALTSFDEVIPCFIFNPIQITPHRYFSANSLQFMIESLEELSEAFSARQGKLYVCSGDSSEVVRTLIAQSEISAVYLNKDYTPFSRERDKKISEICADSGADFKSFSDALLVEPSKFGKSDGTPYTVYTPFFKKAALEVIKEPVTVQSGKFFTGKLPITLVNPREFWPQGASAHRRSSGGRKAALEILSKISRFKDYDDERNLPARDATTILSPHNKFGTVSIREVYLRVAKAFGVGHTLIRELFWRDFFTHIAWHFPHVFTGAFNKQYDEIEWRGEKDHFDAWCKGKTGYPIVDAGMRELVQTGFMHNRVRMIVASFLVKDLLINWHEGEAFFAKHLTEYDPAVNNGSWQWAASTGCDAQPYFRIFNPWLQQERFDKQCTYIKKWVPELEKCSPSEIHKLQERPMLRPKGYPELIVDHQTQKVAAIAMFKR